MTAPCWAAVSFSAAVPSVQSPVTDSFAQRPLLSMSSNNQMGSGDWAKTDAAQSREKKNTNRRMVLYIWDHDFLTNRNHRMCAIATALEKIAVYECIDKLKRVRGFRI